MKQRLKQNTPAKQNTDAHGELGLGVLWLIGVLAFAWCVMVWAVSSRTYFVMNYGVAESVLPLLEPFAASSSVMLLSAIVISIWGGWFWLNTKCHTGLQWKAVRYLALSLLPLLLLVMRGTGVWNVSVQSWEVLWLAGWTGLSFGELAAASAPSLIERESRALRTARYCWMAVILLSVLSGVWWFEQSVTYHGNFMLGFNDFGHFLQRVANTEAGRGVLLESPVLPKFWDHFNPGLLLLVPLWKLHPQVSLVFALQAASLAGSGILIYAIARRLGQTSSAACVFGVAWLLQPAVGQMNLAYTYGWHPITFAIPLLLMAIWCLAAKQRVAAGVCTLLALSMEEGVFVIVALFAANCALLSYFEATGEAKQQLICVLATRTWAIVSIGAIVGFYLVYRFSGLAEFQTGRFVALGNSPIEILMSPVFRPAVFWGQVLRWENVLFVAYLWLPCGLVSLSRGWRFLLPTLVPLAVLIVWDHQPAHCIAFQYPSTLLPLFWLASISGACSKNRDALPGAIGALVTGLLLSVFVGQLPFSSRTLGDVEAITYGQSEWRRAAGAEDGVWLSNEVERIRESGDECLATGRIASHLVGCRDVETVGQYLQRREQLSELSDRKGVPIRHYRWIVLDRQESFQQTPEQTGEVEVEARANGFELVVERFGIAVYKRSDD